MVLGLYSEVAERLWEKLSQYRDALALDSLGTSGHTSPWLALCVASPVARTIARDVEAEKNYAFSTRQGDWAVRQIVGNVSMTDYNQHNGTSLRPTL